jgi:hypothetical protein
VNALLRKRFLESVARMENCCGSTFHTRGSKAGRSFADHLVNVAFVSYQLAILCYNQNLLSEREITLAFYAGLIHDTNKLLNASLRQTADKNSIRGLLSQFSPELSFQDDEIEKIQFCVGLHQDSGLQGMKLLIPGSNPSTELLTEIVKFADKFDNFTNPDLSLDPNLKSSCEGVLQNISTISKGKFTHTVLFYYLLREYRGVLSEIVYEVADELLKEKFGIVPIARFANGVVCLADHSTRLNREEYEKIFSELAEKVLAHQAFSTNLLEAAVKFSPSGVRLAESVFDVPLHSLLAKLLALAQKQSGKYNEYAVFLDGLRKIFQKLLEVILEKDDDTRMLKQLFRSLTGIEFDHFPKTEKLEKMYQKILMKASPQQDLQSFMEQVNEKLAPFLARYAGKTLKDTVHRYLQENFVCNGLGEQSLKSITDQLNHYGHYEETCSICGISSKEVATMQSQETPGLKVQVFTNRMRGHSEREPRRRVCQLCRLQALATKAFRYQNNMLLILMLPTNFYPQEFVDVIKDELRGEEPSEEKNDSVSLYQAIFGNRGKITSKVVCHNLAYVPYSHPGADTWQKVATLAATIASALVARFPVRVGVTSELFLLQDDIEFSEKILIKDAPAFVQRMLRNAPLWARVRDTLEGSNVADYLYELAKQPDYLSTAAVIAKRWDNIRPQEFCVELFKIFGGDKVEELQRMAEIAYKWAHTRADNSRVSDHQYLKPFADATRAAKQYNPKLGEDAKDLEALVFECVHRSLPEKGSWDDLKNFVDLFLSLLGKLGKDDLVSGREIFVRDFAKYRNIFLGNVRLIRYRKMMERKERKENEEVR